MNCIYQQCECLFEPTGELALEHLRIRDMLFIETADSL